MKTRISIHKKGIGLITVLILMAFYSCSNDYLHVKQKVAGTIGDTIYMSDLETEKTVDFNLPQGENAHWRILQFPSYLSVSPLEGNFTDGRSSFKLSNLYKIGQWGVLNLPLVFDVEGIGLVQYPLQYMNFGSPNALFTYSLNLEYQTAGSFFIRNLDGGILTWEIKDKPAWLTIINSKQKGILAPGEEEVFSVLISRDNLTKGNYSGEITIWMNTTEKSKKIQVVMKVLEQTLPGTVGNIEGEVVDADFCKESGLMVMAAKNPNRLYFFKQGQPVTTMVLNKVPTSVTISESGDQVAATFTNTDLSLINPESRTITKNIPTGVLASDLALGNNGWAYLAPKPYDDYYLQSVNLNTGLVVKNVLNLDGLSLIKKVPGKNLIYGSKVGWGPDFLIVFDISKGAANDVVDQWWVELAKFWFSEDGERIFTGWRKIYKSPDYLQRGSIMDKPVLAGEIEEIAGSITAIAHSASKNEVIVAYKSYSGGSMILRIDDSGYTRKQVFAVNDCLVVENGTLLTMAPEVSYMYVNKSGTELYLIKKGMNYTGLTYWFYEKIDLK